MRRPYDPSVSLARKVIRIQREIAWLERHRGVFDTAPAERVLREELAYLNATLRLPSLSTTPFRRSA